MVKKLTASQENYLELILGLSRHGPVRMRDIADAAGVRLPSVTRAVGHLTDDGLVQHELYGSVEITASGMEAAHSVVRRDDCLMRLLIEVLGVPEELAASEVCRMEHVVSQDVLLRLETLVEHACDGKSQCWLKGLRQKLSTICPEHNDVLVGNANPHIAVKKMANRKHLKLRNSS